MPSVFFFLLMSRNQKNERRQKLMKKSLNEMPFYFALLVVYIDWRKEPGRLRFFLSFHMNPFYLRIEVTKDQETLKGQFQMREKMISEDINRNLFSVIYQNTHIYITYSLHETWLVFLYPDKFRFVYPKMINKTSSLCVYLCIT